MAKQLTHKLSTPEFTTPPIARDVRCASDWHGSGPTARVDNGTSHMQWKEQLTSFARDGESSGGDTTPSTAPPPARPTKVSAVMPSIKPVPKTLVQARIAACV